jgi:hypothetical protein
MSLPHDCAAMPLPQDSAALSTAARYADGDTCSPFFKVSVEGVIRP